MIGRAREVSALHATLLSDDVHLLTIWGPAGIGKTRLALATAARLVEAFAQRVFFVDLAPITDPALVAPTIRDVLGMPRVTNLPVLDQLRAYLEQKPVLLVLDNLEQVLGARDAIAQLLAACPRLKVLATTREPLHLSWERQYPVPPLGLPDLRRLPAPRAVGEYPAVALFVARAQVIDPEFVLTPANAAAVAELCVRLDGLPLAIELAAARTRVLSAEAILKRLERRLDLLASSNRDGPQRHQTVRAALDWSYDLLNASEQALFRSLAVCVGSCSLRAADTFWPASTILEVATSLVDKSLVQVDQPLAGEPRLRMLETIRAYALERLQASGEAPNLHEQHASYYTALAEEAESRLRGPEQGIWVERLEREHENLRAALAWCLESGATQQGLRLGGALWKFWYMRGHFAEGVEWLTRLLAQPGAAGRTAARANVLNGLGNLAWNRSEYALAQACHTESLSIRRALDDRAGIAASLNNLGLVAWHRADYQTACQLLEDALAQSESLDDGTAQALHLNNLANVRHDQREFAEARRLQEDSLARYVELGNDWGTAMSQGDLARILQAQGDAVRARLLGQQSLAVRARLGDRRGMAESQVALGQLASDERDYAAARAHFAQALTLAGEVGDRRGQACALEGLAVVTVNEGQPAPGLRLAGSAAALREAIGAPASPVHRAWLERQLASAMRVLGKDGVARAWAEGSGLSAEQARAASLASLVQSLETTPEAPAAPVASAALTPRERKTAALLARGLSNREIAAELVITEGTAKLHVKHILRKLGFTCRAQITAWSLQHGVLEPAGASLAS